MNIAEIWDKQKALNEELDNIMYDKYYPIVEYELIKTEKGLQAINVKEVSNATVC